MNKTHCKDIDTFGCIDCGTCTLCIREYYMVTDEVWESASLENGMVCISCLELRLQRTLQKNDFTDVPVNTDHKGWPKSATLAARLMA